MSFGNEQQVKKKSVTLGKIIKSVKQGGSDYIELDILNLKSLKALIDNYGITHLKGLSREDIIKARKEKTLPKLCINVGKKFDADPDFVLGSIYIYEE